MKNNSILIVYALLIFFVSACQKEEQTSIIEEVMITERAKISDDEIIITPKTKVSELQKLTGLSKKDAQQLVQAAKDPEIILLKYIISSKKVDYTQKSAQFSCGSLVLSGSFPFPYNPDICGVNSMNFNSPGVERPALVSMTDDNGDLINTKASYVMDNVEFRNHPGGGRNFEYTRLEDCCVGEWNTSLFSSPMVTGGIQAGVEYNSGTQELTAVATGGTPPYTYNWSTGETSESVLGIDNEVTITDSNGCWDYNSRADICCELLEVCLKSQSWYQTTQIAHYKFYLPFDPDMAGGTLYVQNFQNQTIQEIQLPSFWWWGKTFGFSSTPEEGAIVKYQSPNGCLRVFVIPPAQDYVQCPG